MPSDVSVFAISWAGVRARWDDYLELSKARLTGMVAVTTAVGFVLASTLGVDWLKLGWTLVGTFLVGAGASAFNQLMERKLDARMARTQNRPIPGGRISRDHALGFGLITSISGLAILCPKASGYAALLGLLNLLIYVFIYTPLKTRSTLNTLVGAICGGIPPLMGWIAADDSRSLPPAAWVLGAIMFVWQIPHFMALSVLYKDQYAKAGYKMLPVVDGTGNRTSLMIILYTLALLPLCLQLTYLGVTGWVFAIGGVLLGLGMLMLGFQYTLDRTRSSARNVFLASIIYLPLLLALMLADRQIPNW